MASLNRCVFIGHVGREPEIRSLQNGDQVATFTLAVSESWKDSNGDRKERTEWVRFACFNKNLVGIIEKYVSKGSKLYAEGQMQTRKFQDKDGVERQVSEIVMTRFEGKIVLLDKPSGDREPEPQRGGSGSRQQRAVHDMDDSSEIPF